MTVGSVSRSGQQLIDELTGCCGERPALRHHQVAGQIAGPIHVDGVGPVAIQFGIGVERGRQGRRVVGQGAATSWLVAVRNSMVNVAG